MWDPLGAWPAGRRGLWIGLAVLVAALQGPGFIRDLRPPEAVADFFQEWSSARNVVAGRPAYEPLGASAARYLGKVEDDSHRIYLRYNAHPPTSILLALPLAGLTYSDATLAWNLATLAMLAASLVLVTRGLGIATPWWSAFPAATLLLTCGPFRQHLAQGQLGLALLLLVTGAWAAERSGRPRLAGGLLGAATAIKLFPGLLLVFFAIRRRWDVVLAGAASLAALTAATAAVVGVAAYRDYLGVVLPEVARFRYAWANASLPGLWGKLFGEGARHYDWHVLPLAHWPALATAGTAASCGAVLVAWAWAARRARTRAEADRAFGLTLVAMLLVSPIAWDHYFVILLLPLALLWIDLPRSVAGQYALFGLVVGLWADQVAVWSLGLPDPRLGAGDLRAPLGLAVLLSFQCYALVAAFGLVFGTLVKGRRASGDRDRAIAEGGDPSSSPRRRDLRAEAIPIVPAR